MEVIVFFWLRLNLRVVILSGPPLPNICRRRASTLNRYTKNRLDEQGRAASGDKSVSWTSEEWLYRGKNILALRAYGKWRELV